MTCSHCGNKSITSELIVRDEASRISTKSIINTNVFRPEICVFSQNLSSTAIQYNGSLTSSRGTLLWYWTFTVNGLPFESIINGAASSTTIAITDLALPGNSFAITGTAQSPQLNFFTSENFTVVASVYCVDSVSGDLLTSETTTITNTLAISIPTASFVISQGSNTYDINLDGTASSANGCTGGLTSYSWSVTNSQDVEVYSGTGSTTTVSLPGVDTYTISLTVATATCGTNTVSQSYTANSISPIISFTYANGTNTGDIDFTNTSLADGCVPSTISYQWQVDTGSGYQTFATTTDASYTFTEAGTYPVLLIGTTACGSSELEQSLIISFPQPIADFTIGTTASANERTFTQTSSANSCLPATLTHVWSIFQSSDLVNPIYTDTSSSFNYTFIAGDYRIQLQSSTACGSDTYFEDISIAAGAPIPSFTISATANPAEYTMDASASDANSCSPATITYAWTYKEGANTVGTASGVTDTFTFPNNGTFTVELETTTDCGTATTTQQQIVQINPTAVQSSPSSAGSGQWNLNGINSYSYDDDGQEDRYKWHVRFDTNDLEIVNYTASTISGTYLSGSAAAPTLDMQSLLDKFVYTVLDDSDALNASELSSQFPNVYYNAVQQVNQAALTAAVQAAYPSDTIIFDATAGCFVWLVGTPPTTIEITSS